MSFRIEDKIALTPYELANWQAELIGRGMKPLYPVRTIRSIYFETPGLNIFQDSEEGVLPRKKIRLRHYPDQPELGMALEVKVSSVEGRYKTTRNPIEDEIADMMKNGVLDQQYGIVKPCVVVSYRRQYFTLEGLRITFDSDISYENLAQTNRVQEPWQVCELKAPVETPIDEILRLAEVPRRRFSKFCNGVKAIVDDYPGFAQYPNYMS